LPDLKSHLVRRQAVQLLQIGAQTPTDNWPKVGELQEVYDSLKIPGVHRALRRKKILATSLYQGHTKTFGGQHTIPIGKSGV